MSHSDSILDLDQEIESLEVFVGVLSQELQEISAFVPFMKMLDIIQDTEIQLHFLYRERLVLTREDLR